MRILPSYKLANAVAITAGDVNTASQQLAHQWGYAAQANFTGTPSGTVKLQASLDNVNWSDVTGSPQSVSGAGSFLWNVSLVFYPYVRVYFVYSAGSGAMTVYINSKGE